MTRKEAIERIKARFDKWALDDEDTKAIQTLIPEFNESESEDERVRKALIDLVCTVGEYYLPKLEARNKMLDYLEKQKEHQETCTKFLAKILKHSAEGFRNVLKKKGIDYVPQESFWTSTAGTFSKQECNEFYKWMDDMTMELVTEETPEYKKGFKDGLDASKKEQNGENEECTDFTIYYPLKNGKGEYECIPYSFNDSLTFFFFFKDLIDFH